MKPNVVLSERRWLLTSDFPETHFQSTNPSLAQYESSNTRSSAALSAFSTGQEGQETAFNLEFLLGKLLMYMSTLFFNCWFNLLSFMIHTYFLQVCFVLVIVLHSMLTVQTITQTIVRCSALDLVLSVMLSTGPFIRLHFFKPGEQLIDYPCHLPPLSPLCKDKCRPWNRTLCLPRFRLISCRNNYLNRVILTNPTISRLGASNPEDLRLHGILSLIALHNKDELSRGKDNIKFPLLVFTLVCYWQLMVYIIHNQAIKLNNHHDWATFNVWKNNVRKNKLSE